jgi:hypothetical protein
VRVKAADQAPERRIGGCLDRQEYDAEPGREFTGPESEPGDDAEAATTAALNPPEQFRVGAGVGHPDGAVGGDDFGFEQPGRGHPIVLPEAAEPAALD